MDSLKGKSRPLLLFAPSVNDPGVKEQIERLEQTARSFRDRDMTLLLSAEDETDPSTDLPAAPLSRGEQSALRNRFDVPADQVTLILVGKDGVEKLLTAGPLDPERLYDLIDTMPMRKAELRNRRK